jgi:hypothetical protein
MGFQSPQVAEAAAALRAIPALPLSSFLPPPEEPLGQLPAKSLNEYGNAS